MIRTRGCFAGVLLVLVGACNDRREASGDGATADSAIPAAPTPAGDLTRGLLAIDRGETTFVACDETTPRTVNDQTGGELQRAAAGLGAVAGERIYLVVRAVDVRSPAQGPGARYRDALNVTQVVRAAHPGEGGGCHMPPPKWQFSARGNEPFWGAKVYPDSIVLTQPDPPSPLVFPAVTPVPKGKASLWSTARADGSHRLTLYLDPSGCVDGMSGEYFAYTARVTLDGSMRRGCAEQAFAGP